MAHASRQRKASSNQAQTSRISQDKGQGGPSSSLPKGEISLDKYHEAVQIMEEHAFADAIKTLKARFLHGHPAFNDMAISMMKLHSEKNRIYAGGGTPLGNFDRNASIFKNYPNFPYASPEGFLMCLVMKHIDAILWNLATGRKPPEDACGDVSVYMNILRCMQYPGGEPGR